MQLFYIHFMTMYIPSGHICFTFGSFFKYARRLIFYSAYFHGKSYLCINFEKNEAVLSKLNWSA
jgi:hypothetical protein